MPEVVHVIFVNATEFLLKVIPKNTTEIPYFDPFPRSQLIPKDLDELFEENIEFDKRT